jgi:Peptidase inhibitor family I36
MRRLIRWAALVAAVVTVAAGLITPAAAAPAPSDFRCPRIIAVCGYTEPGGQGELVLIFTDERALDRPIRSAMNNTPLPWCFYSAPDFNGERRAVSRGETVADFGFAVQSARRGECPWQ